MDLHGEHQQGQGTKKNLRTRRNAVFNLLGPRYVVRDRTPCVTVRYQSLEACSKVNTTHCVEHGAIGTSRSTSIRHGHPYWGGRLGFFGRSVLPPPYSYSISEMLFCGSLGPGFAAPSFFLGFLGPQSDTPSLLNASCTFQGQVILVFGTWVQHIQFPFTQTIHVTGIWLPTSCRWLNRGSMWAYTYIYI